VNTEVLRSRLSISNEEEAGAASEEWWIGQQVHPTPPLWSQYSPSSAGVFRAAQTSCSDAHILLCIHLDTSDQAIWLWILLKCDLQLYANITELQMPAVPEHGW
jgi:hypothetical protein